MPWLTNALRVLLAIPGLIALFLPVVWSTSPLEGLARGTWTIAAPFFLSIPIAAWQLRGFLTSPVHCIEVVSSLLLALIGLLCVGWISLDLWQTGTHTNTLLMLTLWVPFILGASLAVRSYLLRFPLQVVAEQLLMAAYLPVSGLSLSVALDSSFAEMESGARMAALAGICYLVLGPLANQGRSNAAL